MRLKSGDVFEVHWLKNRNTIDVIPSDFAHYVHLLVTPSEAERMAKLLINAARRAKKSKVK